MVGFLMVKRETAKSQLVAAFQLAFCRHAIHAARPPSPILGSGGSEGLLAAFRCSLIVLVFDVHPRSLV